MNNDFIRLNPAWLVSGDELSQWVWVKDSNRPALTGSPKWRNYMGFLEDMLSEYGVVDVTKNRWTFQRWHTSDEPSNWSLISAGKPVRVAHYGAYSGSTGPDGITAELVYYDHDNPPTSIKDKIVVIPTLPHPQPPYDEEYRKFYTFNDYEYRTDDPFGPLFEFIDPANTFTFDTMYQLQQQFHEMAIEGEAAGMVIVYDMAFERSAGLYTFPVPRLHALPSLTISREDGARVIADARSGKSATLHLEAALEPAEAYQLIAYLPGRDYGTQADEQILLINHTDGPSITQDNGALGILAIIKYFSQIPKDQRPRTLAVFLDCRHYMPGMEEAHRDVSWFQRHPEVKEPMVGMIQIEHLGEMDYREVAGRVEPVGLPEQSYLWVRNNQKLIDAGIRAVKEHGWRRVQVVAPERPGIHGKFQQWWWGVGVICLRDEVIVSFDDQVIESNMPALDVPGFGLGSFLGHYWTTASGQERWNCELSLAQIKTMTQLTGMLMTANLEDIQPT